MCKIADVLEHNLKYIKSFERILNLSDKQQGRALKQ